MTQELIKIDDFTAMFSVKANTLLHFEKENLLKPAKFEEEKGFRYYTENTLLRLEKISELKDYGLKLPQIRELINLYFTEEDEIVSKEEDVIRLIDIHFNQILDEVDTLDDEYKPGMNMVINLVYEFISLNNLEEDQ